MASSASFLCNVTNPPRPAAANIPSTFITGSAADPPSLEPSAALTEGAPGAAKPGSGALVEGDTTRFLVSTPSSSALSSLISIFCLRSSWISSREDPDLDSTSTFRSFGDDVRAGSLVPLCSRILWSSAAVPRPWAVRLDAIAGSAPPSSATETERETERERESAGKGLCHPLAGNESGVASPSDRAATGRLL